MRTIIIGLLIITSMSLNAQQSFICLTENQSPNTPSGSRSIADKKILRINFHFMLKADGTGNFTEQTDGDGRITYNGYMYAQDLTNWMNGWNSYNIQMNIPPGNTTPVIDKNYFFVLDACYFWRNNTTYNYGTINYTTQGKDKDSVLNIFLTYEPIATNAGGYASSLSPTSKIKYTENRRYWQGYLDNVNSTISYPFDWFLHGTGSNTNHELGHLLGLSHTAMWNNANSCNTGCESPPLPIDFSCGDGCNDTPTAWDMANASGCTVYPNCGWGTGGNPYCSNNMMDYAGANALTPCQIDIIHSSIELANGMRSYTSCAAVSKDLNICDIGYPKVSYFGKVITIGCSATAAVVSNPEKIKVYFSNSVELNNFEVSTSAEFEVIQEAVCTF